LDITSFTVRRSSGRDLSLVRRPRRALPLRKPVLAAMRKDELVEVAEERGVDPEGTKAELIDRLASEDAADE
jgi:hypothetical protein